VASGEALGGRESTMRIAFLGDGSLNHVRRWAGYFHERGHEVLLLSFESVDGCPYPARRLTAHLPTKILGYSSAMGSLKRELAKFGPDIVSALYLGGYGFVAAKSGFRPLAVSSLGSDLLVDYPSSIVHRLQIRYVLTKADLVITDAEELSRTAISVGTPPGKIVKIYMGVDDRIFFPQSRVTGGEAGHGHPRVVSTRNLYPIYHVDLLIDAAPVIRERSDALFIICGDGPERSRLEAKVKGLGLEQSFVFRGTLKPAEIAEELRAADVYVSTSRSDSTSVSLLEAMACGALPVVTDIAANREWIADGVNGLIVPSDDASALAAAVLKALDTPPLRSSGRERNASIIRERGLWRDNMQRAEKAFQQLLNKPARQPLSA
jgi:glycosyltransferase involved in cell wall biosynthesis